MGGQHLGVIEALIETDSLPSIISGTSIGSLAAAIICTRTDEEIRACDLGSMIVNCGWLENKNSFLQNFLNLIKLDELFNASDWYRKSLPLLNGELTFLEAYSRSGRVLNVSVTAENLPVNLNYRTSPNVIIASAVVCSSSLPLFLKASRLLERDPATGVVSERELQLFRDGSLAGDVPRDELQSLFGVRYIIVSQLNPHVTPFLFYRRGQAGAPVVHGKFRGGFFLSFLESAVKEGMRMILKIMDNSEIDLNFLNVNMPKIFLQNFKGNLTIYNNSNYFYKLKRVMSLLSDEDARMYIRHGRVMTYQKMPLIQSRMSIEKALNRLREAVIESEGTYSSRE